MVTVKKSLGVEVERPKATSILYLVGGDDFSALHRLEFNEFYHFSVGASVEIFLIHSSGKSETVFLGPKVDKGEKLQLMIPAGTLQGVRSLGDWSLMGTAMCPGFDFDDFQMPTREELIMKYPDLKADITRFTRPMTF